MKQTIIIDGNVAETACSFSVAGDSLRAILTEPVPGTPLKGGIVFSHGWSGFRSGPAGILTAYARAFARQGYASIRFDFRGRGESQGSGLDATLATMADDLVAATAFFQARLGLKHLALCGICSGGNVVVGTLKRLPQASQLLLLSIYPFSDGDAFGRDVHRTFHYLGVYMRKMVRPETWARLCKGDISLGNVCHVIFGHFFRKNDNQRKEGTRGQEPARQGQLPKAVKAATVESRSQTKEPPRKFLANLRQDLPGIIVYGEADPDASAASSYYGSYIAAHSLPLEIRTIPGANHNFSSPDWRNQAFKLLENNLKNNTCPRTINT